MDGSCDLRIVLLGKTGIGKSSTGNTILGEEKEVFPTSRSPESLTSECKAETRTVNGRSITVVDTPGLLSNNLSGKKNKIFKCLELCQPGPHAFLILMKVQKNTNENKKAIDQIKNLFGEKVLKYSVVVFTHGDELNDDSETITIEQFVDTDSYLKALIKDCGNRVHVIDNKYWERDENAERIKNLLTQIDQMKEQNGEYTFVATYSPNCRIA